MGLDQFKEKYPQYNDWDDQDLASALYEKYGESSGVARNEFMADIGRPQYMDATPSETEANMMKAGTVKPVAQEPEVAQPQQPQQERQIYGLGDEDFTNYPDNPELAASQIGEPGLARAAALNTPTPAPDNRPERTWGTTWDEALKAVPRALGQTFQYLNEMSYQQSIRAAKGDPRVVERVNKARQNPDFLVKLATDPRFAATNYKPTGKPHVDFWMDALGTAPVYGVMGLGTVVGGPAGGMIAMGTQIFGPAFEEGLQQGMTFENAAEAAVLRTAGETMLEQVGFSSIMRNVIRVPGVRKYIESTVTEGTTEYLQSQLGAGVNAFILGRQRGYSDVQLSKAVLDAVKANHGQAKYEGAIGSVFGLGGTAGGSAAVSGYNKVLDKATANLRMHLDTGISQQDPEKVKQTEKMLKELEALKQKLHDAKDEDVPDQKEAEKELADLDPRLVKEMERRRLFDDDLGVVAGGPRMFEGTGPGGTTAPVQEGEIQAPPETVGDLHLGQEKKAFEPEPEAEFEPVEEPDVELDIEDEPMTPIGEDVPPAPEEDKGPAGFPLFNTQEEAEKHYTDLLKKYKTQQKNSPFMVSEVNGKYTLVRYEDIPAGTVKFDLGTVKDQGIRKQALLLENLLNKRDKNGKRAWRFGYLLDSLEAMGEQFKFTLEPDNVGDMHGTRAMFTRGLDQEGKMVYGIVRLRQGYIKNTANASMDIAHEILHGLVHAIRNRMSDSQLNKFRIDLADTLNRINYADIQNNIMALSGLEKNTDSQIKKDQYNNAQAGLKVLLRMKDEMNMLGFENVDPQRLGELDELMTYALTNPEVAKSMDTIRVQNPSKSWVKTMWDELVYKVSSMLGMTDDKSAFDEIKRIMSTHMEMAVPPLKAKPKKAAAPKKAVAKAKPTPKKEKGYTFKSVNKALANEVNDILKDYQDVLKDNKKLVDKFITMAERATLREATPDRKFVEGEPALMKELGPDEFAKKRFYINNKGKKTRWYTDNDIKNFNAFRDAAKELMAISPELVTDIEQAIGEFVKAPEKRMMPKGYVTSIVDGEVIDHPKGWVSPKAKKKAPAKKPAKKAKPEVDTKAKLVKQLITRWTKQFKYLEAGTIKEFADGVANGLMTEQRAVKDLKAANLKAKTSKKPAKKVEPKKAKPEATTHGFPTEPGTITLERGTTDGKLEKDPYELGYHFALGEDTELAKHFGDVIKYTMKIAPSKFVIMDDPNTWDNWDNMIDTLEASIGKYGEANDTKIKRLLDAFEPYRGTGAGEETIIQEMETIFNTLGLEGAFYNAIKEEGGGGPAVMFVKKPKVNKKKPKANKQKQPKTTAKGKTKDTVLKEIEQNKDILKNIKDTKYLEKEWGKAAQQVGIAKEAGDTKKVKALEARIDIIKAALFGGAVNTSNQASIADLWHGSPHYWEGLIPKLKKIGTGEGAQVFGWGLYFSTRIGIAKHYAVTLSRKFRFTEGMSDVTREGIVEAFVEWMEGVGENEVSSRVLEKVGDHMYDMINDSIGKLDRNVWHSAQELKNFEKGIEKYGKMNNLPEFFINNMVNFGDWIIEYVAEINENIGNRHMYQITLHKGKDPKDYLYASYYDPIKTQPRLLKIIKEAKLTQGLKKKYGASKADQALTLLKGAKQPVGQLYDRMTELLGNQELASRFLYDLGVDGFVYPVDSLIGGNMDMARGRNYVIFDSKAVTVEEHNQFSSMTDKDGLDPKFQAAAEAALNEAAPGYELRLEHYWPKSSGAMPYGYGFHVSNPDSILHRASFTLMSDTIDPQKVRDMIAERQKIFEDAKAGKVYRVNQKSAKYEDPDMEKDFQNYRVGVAKDTWMTRVAEFFIGVKNKFREFENISRKKLGQYAEATKELRRLRNYRGIASSKAIAKLGKILNGLNKDQYEIFERLVTMADFWEQHKINEQRVANGESELDIPFDWPKESVEKEFAKLVTLAMRDQALKNAWEARLDTWAELKSEYGQAMKDVGFDVEKRMQRTLYFRHQVVDYLKAKGPSTVATKKLATPANRSHLRARKGTVRPINLNYIQAEYEVMAQLLYDVQIAKTIKTIKDNFDIVDQLKEEQGEQELENYTIPEGYVAWRPREGSVMYLADTIPSKLVEEAISKGLKQLKVKTKDISKVLVVGRKHSEMVIPEDLAETLNSYLDSQKKGVVGRFFRGMMTGWKAWQLVSPFRVVKYNLRNMTGDAEAVFVGGQTYSTGRKMFTQAGADIIKKLLGKETSNEYKEWVDRGGLESNFTTQEMADILRSPEFKNVTGKGGAVKLFAKRVWKLPRTLTDAREQWMRYASYLAFLEKLETGKFKPTDYAASIPEEIDNLQDNRDKAFVLSNDLLGAYDRVTEAGDFMRRHVAPFYSFQEVNASRAAQIWRNMVANDKIVGSIARKILGKTAAKSVVLTLATGQVAVTLMFWSTLLQIFNNLYYPEEEDALPDDLRETPHIYMGPPGQEHVRYFPRVGLLGDLLEWGNLQSAPLKLADLLTGRTTLEDAKKEINKYATKEGLFDATGGMTIQLMRKLSGMLGPQYKVPFELVTMQKLFPDATNPTPIDDWKAHIADQFLPKEAGNLIRQRPMAKTWKSDMVESLYTYKQDLTKMAYNATKARKVQWLKDMGFRGKGYHSSEKATAAYNMSLAFRYGDTTAFKKYFVDYIKLSYGKVKDIGTMMEQLDPLYGMTNQQKALFVATLDKNELKGLELAYKHYIELRSGVQFTGGK